MGPTWVRVPGMAWKFLVKGVKKPKQPRPHVSHDRPARKSGHVSHHALIHSNPIAAAAAALQLHNGPWSPIVFKKQVPVLAVTDCCLYEVVLKFFQTWNKSFFTTNFFMIKHHSHSSLFWERKLFEQDRVGQSNVCGKSKQWRAAASSEKAIVWFPPVLFVGVFGAAVVVMY